MVDARSIMEIVITPSHSERARPKWLAAAGAPAYSGGGGLMAGCGTAPPHVCRANAFTKVK